MKYYIHHTPGRLRIKIPVIRRKPHRVAKVKALFDDVASIQSLSIKPLTGSVVFYFNPDELNAHQIIALLKANGYFDASNVVTQDEYIEGAAVKAGVSCRKAIFGWAIGRALEANGLSVLAAFI
jgi:hypothetical protein